MKSSETCFPILFVTVACGAISGFHSLVSSDTSSKTIANEKDMLKVGYGAMVLESLLAVVALCVAGAAASADGTPAAGTPVPGILQRRWQASWKCSVSRFMLPSAS